MKKVISNTLMLLALATFLACKKSDNTTPTNKNCQISCKVDGVLYNVSAAHSCAYLGNSLNVGQTGQDAIQLQVNNLTAPGTFNIADQNTVIVITLNNGTTIGGITGQIIVDEISNSKASGTFSGSFYNLSDITQTPAFTVTEGTFSASF